MDHRVTRCASSLGLATLLAVLPPTLAAQEPAKGPDEPVRAKLEAFQRGAATRTPADRMKAAEEGVEQIKKSGVLERALKVGDRAPDFRLPNASGREVKLSTLLEDGPVVVTWYRGAWCPFCNIALRGFQEALPEIKAEGATLVAISPQMPDKTAETIVKAGLGFEVLSDRGNKVARAYGVVYKLPAATAGLMKGNVDLDKYNGDASGELPLAVTYVIDRQGVIRYAFVDGDSRKRAEPSAVVAALKKLERPH